MVLIQPPNESSPPVRLLLVSTNADYSGAPLHVLDLGLALASRGNEVAFVFGSDGPVEKELDSLGFRTTIIKRMRSIFSPIQDISAYLQLVVSVKEHKPDLLHAHSSKAGMLARLVGYALKIPVVFTVHGWGFGPGRGLIQNFLVMAVERVLIPKTNRYIAVSDYDRQQGLTLLGLSPEKIVTVHNRGRFAVSPSELRPLAANVIMVARNSNQKDYSTFANALANAEFDRALFVGEGTNEAAFMSDVTKASHTASAKVQFVGKTDAVSQLLEESSIFVLSTRYEGLPLSIIEAMSKGLPIIATDVGGVSELVQHGNNGFLFEVGDVSALTKFISLLSTDAVLRRKMGNASQRIYEEKFAGNTMLDSTLAAYDAVLRERSFR